MTINSYSGSGYNPYLVNPYLTTSNTGTTSPINFTATASQTVKAKATETTKKENKDDGKIGFFDKVGSFFKGVVKSAVNIGKTIIQHPFKTALIVGLCLIPGVGPIIATGLAAYGAVKGASTIVKAAGKAANATTDAEAERAFEDMGGGALEVGLSVAGIRATGAAAKASIVKGTNAVGKLEEGASILTKAKTFGKGVTGVSEEATTVGQVAKELGKGTLDNAKIVGKAIKSKAGDLKNRFTKGSEATTVEETANAAENVEEIAEVTNKGIKSEKIDQYGNRTIETVDNRVITIDKQGNIIYQNIDVDGSFQINRFGETKVYNTTEQVLPHGNKEQVLLPGNKEQVLLPGNKEQVLLPENKEQVLLPGNKTEKLSTLNSADASIIKEIASELYSKIKNGELCEAQLKELLKGSDKAAADAVVTELIQLYKSEHAMVVEGNPTEVSTATRKITPEKEYVDADYKVIDEQPSLEEPRKVAQKEVEEKISESNEKIKKYEEELNNKDLSEAEKKVIKSKLSDEQLKLIKTVATGLTSELPTANDPWVPAAATASSPITQYPSSIPQYQNKVLPGLSFNESTQMWA